uniref:exopolysaccharide biosynthesis polyprenyl glycosylphosphotransferase n=1 Tax=Streptomyces flavofungini TaxID=68200 RepID=UPI003F7EC731
MSAERTVASSTEQPLSAAGQPMSAAGPPMADQHAPAGPLVVAPRGARGARAGTPARRPARGRRTAAALVTADAVAALLALLLLGEPRRYALLAPLLLAGVIALNARGRLYAYTALPATLDEVPSLCGRVALGWLLTAVLAPALPALAPPLPLRTLLTVAAAQCLISVCGRALIHRHLRSRALRRPRPVLVLGPGGQAQALAAALLRRPRCGMRPVGVVDETGEQRPADEDGAEQPGLPVLRTEDELHRAVIQNDVSAVLLLAGRGPGPADRLPALRGLGVDLWEIDPRGPGMTPRQESARTHVAGFPCRPLLPAGGRRIGLGKRLLDCAVSGVLLLIAAPALLTCAFVLRVTEGPGVVFRQERVGKDGRLFTLLKFRTHRPADPQEAATRWSVADEHRMSAFCRFLRSTSLDELPQLWNVLRGDMSLVGPRPERPFFVTQFSQAYPHYAQRHRMPTGITGLAQIHGLRGDTSIEDRCRFDNAYIDSWSFWQDLCILLRTVGCLVRR